MIAPALSDPLLAIAALVVAGFALGVLAAFAVLELEWRYRSRHARRVRPVRDIDLTRVRP